MKKTILTICFGLAVAAAATAQDNILKNGNFNYEGDPGKDWTLKPDSQNANSAQIVNTNGVNGSGSAKLGIANTELNASIEQEVTLESGKRYVFSGVFYYSAKPTNDKLSKVQLLSASDNSVLQTEDIPFTQAFTPNAQTNWTSELINALTFKFEVAENISGNVILSVNSGGINKVLRFDNLSLAESIASGISETVAAETSVSVKNGAILISGNGLSAIPIYSVSGQLVKTVDMTGTTEAEVTGLAKGIYIVGTHKVIL